MEDALCIVVHVVEGAKSCDSELCDVCPTFLEDVETAEHISGEVEACEVVKQHVVAGICSGFGMGVVECGACRVSNEEDERHIAVR